MNNTFHSRIPQSMAQVSYTVNFSIFLTVVLLAVTFFMWGRNDPQFVVDSRYEPRTGGEEKHDSKTTADIGQ